jgi:hypothetical protein
MAGKNESEEVMGAAEFIAVAIATVRIAPEIWDTIKIWAETGHEPTADEIQALEQKYDLRSAALRERIELAKARLAKPTE